MAEKVKVKRTDPSVGTRFPLSTHATTFRQSPKCHSQIPLRLSPIKHMEKRLHLAPSMAGTKNLSTNDLGLTDFTGKEADFSGGETTATPLQQTAFLDHLFLVNPN